MKDISDTYTRNSMGAEKLIEMRSLSGNNDGESSTFFIIASLCGVFFILMVFFAVISSCKPEESYSLRLYLTGQVSRDTSDTIYRNRMAQELEFKKKEKEELPSKRRERLRKIFQENHVIMEVKSDDLINSSHSHTSESNMKGTNKIDGKISGMKESTEIADDVTLETIVDNSEEISKLELPVFGKAHSRIVPNNCAICLSSYEIGDNVVWSSNEQCNHAFHKECIIEWLVKMQEGTPCPCCRQDFVELPPFVPICKVDFDMQPAFNPAIISF